MMTSTRAASAADRVTACQRSAGLSSRWISRRTTAVDRLPWNGTLLSGLSRRLIFDYSITQFDRRCSQLRLLPGSALPAFVAGGAVDIFVLGGDLRIGGETILGDGFAVIEPDAEVVMRSGYDC